MLGMAFLNILNISKRAILPILILCAGLIEPQSTQGADTQAKDLDRLDRRAELIGWEGVGRLDVAGLGTCSGALIAPDLVLTAAHCVVRENDNKAIDPKHIMFRAGLRNGDFIAASRGLKVAVSPDYRNGRKVTGEMVRKDVALIQLATHVARSLATPFALHSSGIKNGELAVASYGQGRNGALSVQRACNVLIYAKGLLDFDCDITFGSSGAPVFALDGGRKRIVSVVSAGSTRGNRSVGHGMSLLDIVPALKRQIASGSYSFAPKPVVTRRISVGGATARARAVGNSKFLSPN
jgi:protease YdgD